MKAHASFDAIALAYHLEPSVGPVARGEIHLFGYLACLLFLFRNNPVSDWEYGFAATEFGAPFSTDLNAAIVEHEQVGLLARRGLLFEVTDRGRGEYETLRGLSSFAERDEYLEAASSSSLAVPVGLVRRAISAEPQITASRQFRSHRPLLDELALDSLYTYFGALREAVGVHETDLLAPAVVWLRYLSAESDNKDLDSGG